MFSVTGMPWSRRIALKMSLSMQSAEASTPAPTYGTPASSSRPCTVPSSPNGPCRIGKTTSTSASAAATSFGGSRSGTGARVVGVAGLERRSAGGELPAAAAIDSHRDHVVAVRLECRHDARSRRNRDRVLTRAAAEDDRDAATHGVVVVVVVPVVVVPPVCSCPTLMITVSPAVAGEPGFGSSDCTMPSCVGSVTGT